MKQLVLHLLEVNKIQDIPGSAHKGEVVMLPPGSFKIQDIPGSATY